MELSFKVGVNSTAKEIWNYYSDVQKWYVWDEALEDISLNGSFDSGTTGAMKLAGMPPVEFSLVEVLQQKRFCNKTSTPFGDIYFDHQITEEIDGLFIKHAVSLDSKNASPKKLGFLEQIFSGVPKSVMNIKSEVEK